MIFSNQVLIGQFFFSFHTTYCFQKSLTVDFVWSIFIVLVRQNEGGCYRTESVWSGGVPTAAERRTPNRWSVHSPGRQRKTRSTG